MSSDKITTLFGYFRVNNFFDNIPNKILIFEDKHERKGANVLFYTGKICFSSEPINHLHKLPILMYFYAYMI